MRSKVTTILFCCLLTTSCGMFRSHDQGAPDSPKLKDVQERAAVYQKLLGDPYKLGIARCDNLTFQGHYVAGMNPYQEEIGKQIYQHEYDLNADGTKTYGTGQIHRDVEPCNTNPEAVGPKMDSRSECSKENVLAWFHVMWSRKDTDAILRTIRRARADDWHFCRGGDESYDHMLEFSALLNDVEKKLTGSLMLSEEADAIAIPKLEGYRGNVLNSYILLKSRIFGYINTAEKSALQSLVATVPDSPLYRSVLHRFDDGDQYTALRQMTSSFWPADRLPNCKVGDPNVFQWEGAHCAMLYVWTVAVIGGI